MWIPLDYGLFLSPRRTQFLKRAGTVLLSPQKLNAFELTGAWATSADKCGKIFARKGRANQVNFTNFSGLHGGGFIAEANRLRGKSESCLIKSKKESDQSHLIVTCASGVMLSNVQFFLKVLDDNTISREFPGMEGMEVKYHRCPMNARSAGVTADPIAASVRLPDLNAGKQ